MGDWTAEAEPAVLLCQDWAKSVQTVAKIHLYLFGSAIYKGGEQFDRYTSDIDIVAVLPPELDPADRVNTLEELRKHKIQLELNMIPALRRRTCDEAGVSLVPITPLELRTNVHKSGARRFFDKNFFLDLFSGVERVGLPDAGIATLPDENRAVLEYVQKVRNQYLGQSANLCGGLGPYSGADPMPKALLRFAAQLDPAAEEGEWYDTRRGLELMFDRLRDRRTEPAFRPLFDRVSVRRGGRGEFQKLSSRDQLLLAELLHDIAANVPIEDVVQWEVRVTSGPVSVGDINRLVNAMRAVAPDAILISVGLGSVILRFQSSRSRFDTVQLLFERKVLAILLDAESIDLRLLDADLGDVEHEAEFQAHDREQQLRDVIGRWTADFDREIDGERQLEAWLKQAVRGGTIPNARIVSEPLLRGDGKISRPDIVVMWDDGPQEEMIAVELIQLRTVARFFRTVERMLELPYKVILVVVGPEDKLASIRKDFERLERVGGSVRVVPIVSTSPALSNSHD